MSNLESQQGKIIIVTGGNSGVGFEAARHLALKGAHVTFISRSVERGKAAAATIREALATVGPAAGTVTAAHADLADLSSVKAFAAAFVASHSSLDVLLNNAGVMMLPRTLNQDGEELQMATNHLGHFALTGLLMPLLAATPGARIVNVSSHAHRTCTDLSLDDWTMERSYTPWSAYARSKMSNHLFTHELNRRLAAKGGSTPVLAVTAQPGWALTSLAGKATISGSWMAFINVFQHVFSHSAESGARPLVYAATESDVVANDYWGPSFLGLKGAPGREKASSMTSDAGAAAALWAKSEEVTQVSFLG
ncbi:hypothetical protein MMPV_006050 [Pyropia vietnamensis]